MKHFNKEQTRITCLKLALGIAWYQRFWWPRSVMSQSLFEGFCVKLWEDVYLQTLNLDCRTSGNVGLHGEVSVLFPALHQAR